MTDRDRFLALVYNQPLRRADAIVVLCGEDAEARAEVALQLFKQGAAPMILCSGGKDDGRRWWGAERVQGWLMGNGIAPDRLMSDPDSDNTREQASECAFLAHEFSWHSLLLVASAYHLPRAFLAFVRARSDSDLRITPVAATPPWCDAPPGCDRTRLDLLADEFRKIEEYGALGHVASYAEGIEYLTHWESHGQTTKAA